MPNNLRGMYPVYFGFIPICLYSVPCSAINVLTVDTGSLDRKQHVDEFIFTIPFTLDFDSG